MSTANCAEELDFRLIFEEDGRQPIALDVRANPSSTQTLDLQAPNLHFYQHHVAPQSQPHPQLQGSQYGAQGNPRAFDCPSIQITSIAPNNHIDQSQDVPGAEGGYSDASWSRDQLYLPVDACYRDQALCPSPCSSLSSRSWMSDLSSCESFSCACDDVEGELQDAARLALGLPHGSPLGSPGCGGGAFGVELWQQKYQHPMAFSPALSPHQSPLGSPCHSPRTSVTEESWLNRLPTSRPTSPYGKRRHGSSDPRARSPSPLHSPSPTPGASPRGSVTDDTWVGSPGAALGALLMSGYTELDVPSKTRRTSGQQLGVLTGQADPVLEELRTTIPFQDSPGEETHDRDGLAELFLQVPSHFSWNKPKPGSTPLFSASSPPPLDWPLPNQFNGLELTVEVQPKSYHRAHYETEGSRGSLKAASGGHPLVKLSGFSDQPVSLLLFIGTADDGYIRPHSFYQVHRVTGKTVSTNCHEKVQGNTKVLEIRLLPENGMSASIDCAGILKLRNADIELKKGETDIGRKNTRVRVTFRVAVPQPDGQILWLQTASGPIECSQRSGQELPHVDSFSPSCCCEDGGDEMVITGSNVSTQSKVVFLEKGPDGRSVWEMEARIAPEKSSGASIVVQIPPYNKNLSGPVQVQFYVSNGKRRRSLMQSFTFLPVSHRPLLTTISAPPPLVKRERGWEQLDRLSHTAPGFSAQPSPDLSYYNSGELPVHCGPPQNPLPRLHHSPQPHPVPLPTLINYPQSSTVPLQPPSIPQAALGSNLAYVVPPKPGSRGEAGVCVSPSLSRAAFATSAEPQKGPALLNAVPVLNIKQEPEDQPNPGCLGLQEITLDDVNEIIDRDISGLCSDMSQYDLFQSFEWEHHKSKDALPFCEAPQ
ncbi:nuclear factor of activated T-cells, cytoplasmic 3 isoform X2 [Eucyclogobius newberryi]|uniref:nuclear factor of activated T-cells, cytoplasmic 3 isoform X2 n=1 Tax=Eucyclogobius newberryi TaxID=166745 RepID=UPI003B5A0E34